MRQRGLLQEQQPRPIERILHEKDVARQLQRGLVGHQQPLTLGDQFVVIVGLIGERHLRESQVLRGQLDVFQGIAGVGKATLRDASSMPVAAYAGFALADADGAG